MHRFAAAQILSTAFAITAGAQAPDTSLYTASLDVRLGATQAALKRAVGVGTGVAYDNTTLRGVELFLMGAQPGGLRLSYEVATLPSGAGNSSGLKYEIVDARIYLGTHFFSIVPGWTLRSMPWNAAQRRFSIPQLGLEGGRAFPGAGLLVKMGGQYLRTVDAAKVDSVEMWGILAHTSVTYAPPRYPVYIGIGYRREITTFRRGSLTDRRDETTAVVLSAGIQSGISKR